MQKASPLWSAIVWFVIAACTIGYSLLILLYVLVFWWADPSRKGAHWLASLWGRSVLRCIPSWRLTVNGRAALDSRRSYIYVANHQSLIDIMALLCINQPFKWVAKESLFRIPFLGWSMGLAKHIRLARGRHGSIRETYEQARLWLARGISVFFFPEGTRSPDGEIHEFKALVGVLALTHGVDILPVWLGGTHAAMPKGSRVPPRSAAKESFLKARGIAPKSGV